MNDDYTRWSVLRDLINQTSVTRNWINDDFSSMSTQSIYEALTLAREEEKKMPYYTGYNNTRGDEVATAVLEAYSKGIDFETLLKKNIQVRDYWKQILKEKVSADQAKEKEKIRLAKLAAKRAAEQAQKEEVMAKLTPEELEAFGLAKKPRKVTKR
jgi:uncharacterized protein YktA (UPF0223 family)